MGVEKALDALWILLWPLPFSLRSIRRRPFGWLSEEIDRAIARTRRRVGIRRRLLFLASPQPATIGIGIVLLIVSLWASFVLERFAPRILTEERVSNLFGTLWQVQTAVAAIALPVLIFVIELSRDNRQAATRSHEVLIQETFVFPIIVFSLLGSVRIGVDMALFPSGWVVLLDLALVFVPTIVLAVFAYYRSLLLTLNPNRMKAKAKAVVRARMHASLRASIRFRVGNRALMDALSKLGIGYWPFAPSPREAGQYLALRGPGAGILVDVNLAALKEFVDGLPWKSWRRAAVVGGRVERPIEDSRVDPGKARHDVWFMKGYGQDLAINNRFIIRLSRNAFQPLDPQTLEAQLAKIIKLRSKE